MGDPLAMDANDLETENQNNNETEGENTPELTANMDGSFLVDEPFLIAEVPEMSDEMDYTEEIGAHASYDPSMTSEQEVPTHNAVQAENPAQETDTSQTEVQQSESISAQSVPASSHPNTSKEPTNNLQAQNYYIGEDATGFTSTSTASANALQPTLNVQQMIMMQKMMRMRQTGILPQRMNVPNIGIPNLRMMSNTSGPSQLSLNQQRINFMQVRAPRLPALPWMQNRIRAPQIPMQAQRPQLNLRFPRPDLLRLGTGYLVQGARNIPSVHVQSPGLNEQRKQEQQQKLLQLELQQLQKQQQQLQKQQQMLQLQIQQQKKHQQQQIHQQQQPLIQQGQALEDQLYIMRNFRAQSLRANAMCGRMRPQGINAQQINISQNVLQGRAPTNLSTSSHQGVQHPLSQTIVPPPPLPKIQSNVLNVPQRVNMNPLVSNISQLNVNTVNGTKNATQLVGNRQLRVPQIPSNMLQLEAPQCGNVSHLEMQQLVARAEQLARSVTQLNVSQTGANLPQVCTPQLPSNLPQVVPSVPQLNVPHMATNMPQILRNVQQLCLHQARNTPQLRMPQLAGNVSPLCVHQSPARFNVPPLSFSQPSSNVAHLGVSLPSASVPNLGLQADLLGNMPRAPPLTANVRHVRMPQTTAGVLHLGERYQKITGPRYERLQRLHRLEFEERQHKLQIPSMGEPQVTGAQQIVTGVTQQLSGVLQQSLNSSQQSASAPQPVDGQKLIELPRQHGDGLPLLHFPV